MEKSQSGSGKSEPFYLGLWWCYMILAMGFILALPSIKFEYSSKAFASTGTALTNTETNLERGRRLLGEKKFAEAAFAFTNGCMANDVDSCEGLAAVGALTNDDNMLTFGATRSCLLGKTNGCLVAGSALVLQKKGSEGVDLLRRGCRGGDRDCCSQLDTLRQRH